MILAGEEIYKWLVAPWSVTPSPVAFSASDAPWDAIKTIRCPDVIRKLHVNERDHLIVTTDFAQYRLVDGKRMRLKKIT